MSLRLWLALGALALLVALLLGGVIALRLRRVFESSASSQRARRGLRGEKQAEALLERHGYRVLDRQIAGGYEADLDGESRQVALSADLLVERQGRRLIAEVKTGPKAARFEHADTRRQLLEYQLAFGGDAVLLVDPERETIQEVRFPLRAAQTENAKSFGALWLWTVLGAIALALGWRAIDG